MRQLNQAVLYDWELAGRSLRLWKPVGESYEHVLMKALGYAMFVSEYPNLQVEQKVGLRYKPDLVSRDEHGRFHFWGECGSVTIRKLGWLLKHARVERLVVFKLNGGATQLAGELRDEIDSRYRAPDRISVINFAPEIIEHTITRRIARVPLDWYNVVDV